MNSRATFGDFIRAADQHLDEAFVELAVIRTTTDGGTLVREATAGLRRLVTVLERCARDLTPADWQVPERYRPLLTAWGRASIQAREALSHSAALLRAAGSGQEPRADDTEPGSIYRRLESAARELSIGRDLLGTHFATGIDGSRQGRSEWAPVIDSDPVSRALMAEIVSLGAMTGSHCARLTWISGGTPETAPARQRLSAACHWLMAAGCAIQSADQADSVPRDTHELLHAIPVNAEPERPVLRGDETVTELCEGAIAIAERARRASRALVRDAAWSPATSGTSLRHAAAACAATSYHCEILLRTLAGQQFPERSQLHDQLLGSADTVRNARATWLKAAHSWDQMFTDAPKVTSRAAADTADLAYWTGRLAFADAEWTLSRGPSQAIRPPESLAANPEDARCVIATVHHACETITRLAGSDYQQIQVAARAGRLLVTTRSLDESYDIPHPITRAPAHRVDAVIATYGDAEAVSRTATTVMDQLAATTGTASRLLTAARNAIAPTHGDAQNTAEVRDPQVAPLAREVESAGSAQRFVRPPPAAEDTPLQPGTAARRLARGVIGPNREPPLPQRQSACEVGEPIVAAPTSDAIADRHIRIDAAARSLGASRSKELELEL